MQSLWLEDQTLSWQPDTPEPIPQAGQALLQVRLAGICSTDLEMLDGYYPFRGVPGHEFVGEVVGLGPGVDQTWLGQRVAAEINVWCGQCPACQCGQRTHCQRRKVLGIKELDGVFAERLVTPVCNLHPIPDCVSDDAAVFVEPLAAALQIQTQVWVQPEMRVLVVGAGRLGHLVAQTLALSGCRLQVAARHARQQQLLEARRIRVVTEADIQPASQDLVVDAAGSPSGWELARRAVRPGGVVVLKSTYAGSLTANFSSLVVDEITLVGSRCGPFAPAVRLLEAGQVDPTCLIDARFPLEDGKAAYQRAAQPGALKVLLTP